jgi:hypothetical protein
MQRKHKVAFVTIVPSPYQRDLFGALAALRYRTSEQRASG